MTIELSSSKKMSSYKLEDNIFVSADIDLVKRQDEECIAFGKNSMATGISTVAYTDNSFATGEGTTAGTHSFRMISGDTNLKTWKLSNTTGLQAGMLYSVRICNNYDCAGRIVEVVDSTTISVDAMPKWIKARTDENLSDVQLSDTPWYMPDGNGLRGHYGLVDPMSCFIDEDEDSNTLWIVGHPELGELSSYATGAFAHGYDTLAQMQYSHAEGIETIAGGKYSHAEGIGSIAGYCSHAEGNQTEAFGVNSHAEGAFTKATNMNTHAEGIYSEANGYGSHADGLCAIANSGNSFVWNGRYAKYEDHGDGTFNIGPKGGLSGFYIDEKNIIQHIEDCILKSSTVGKVVHDNNILKQMVEFLQDELSAKDAYIPAKYDICVLSAYAKWDNKTNLEFCKGVNGYSCVSAAVIPGETLSVVEANCNWYAGFVGLNEKLERVCSWDMSKYVRDMVSGDVFMYGSSRLEGMTEEELSTKTVDDRFHWYRLEVPNASFIANGGNNAEFVVPENCYYIVFTTYNVEKPEIYRKGRSVEYVGQQFSEIDKQLNEITGK